jgi:mannitol/fructose-specific phosphotransferase system IIA component (Ntr-type)
MPLSDFIDPQAADLALRATTKDAVLAELVGLLRLGPEESETLLRALRRREALGSTGVGRGIAVPHARVPLVPRLRIAYGRHPIGLDYHAIDGKPVRHFFLIVAPPEGAQTYLSVLGRIAQLGTDPGVVERLDALQTPDQFFALLRERAA